MPSPDATREQIIEPREVAVEPRSFLDPPRVPNSNYDSEKEFQEIE